MEQLYYQTYEGPWGYEEDAVVPVQLAGYNFTVTDAATGYPISGALCVIYAGPDGTGDGDGVLTDSQGKAGIDAIWFPPKSWSVSKEGYLRKLSNYVVSNIQVALESTAVQYTVRIYSGSGGSTDPSGALTVAPGTQLTVRAIPNSGYDFDYWTYKGQNMGSINPLAFLIDRDAITILASFKEGVTPPPNGEPPTEWPVQKQVPFTGRLAPGWALEATDSTPIKNVDLTRILGGRVDYALRYESGILPGMMVYIYWNDELMASERLSNVGQTATGTFELGTARIRATNTLSIKMVQGPLGYNICSFDCPTILGFSEEPDQPPTGEDWLDWLKKNAWWIALGAGTVIIGIALISMARPPVVIYQPPGKGG